MLLWTATDLHVLLYIPQSEECVQHHAVLKKYNSNLMMFKKNSCIVYYIKKRTLDCFVSFFLACGDGCMMRFTSYRH